MAQDNILGDITDAKTLLDAGSWLAAAPGGASVATGGLLPGGIAAYQGPGMGAAVATGSLLAAAVPFLGLTAFVLPKILGSMFGPNPQIGFSGTQPQYGYGNGRYTGPQQDQANLSVANPSSKKYDYVINVEDTGKDSEIEQMLVGVFDQYFDSLSAQGIPVNDLLARNKNFYFGGGLNLDDMFNDIVTHLSPDIEAYKSGTEPPPRQIKVDPTGTPKGVSGRDMADMGIKNEPYSVVIGSGGAVRDKNISLSPNDPRVSLLKAASGDPTYQGRGRDSLPQNVSLAPGYTYSIDTSKLSGRDMDDFGLLNISPYAVPGGADDNDITTKKSGEMLDNDIVTKKSGEVLEDTGGNMNTTIDPDLSAFEQYVDMVYDQVAQELQNQSDQYRTAADARKQTSDTLLQNQSGMVGDLTNRLDSAVSDYSATQNQNLGQLDSRQNELFDTAKTEQQGYLDRLIGAIDDTHSSNLPQVHRMAGGQQVSYIPSSLRAANNDDRTAELSLFDKSKGMSDTFLNTGTQQAQYLNNAQANTAGNVMNFSTSGANSIWDAGNQSVVNAMDENQQNYQNEIALAKDGNAVLNYLDILRQLAEAELGKENQDNQSAYDQARLEASEPGMLDVIKGIGTAGSGIKDIAGLLTGTEKAPSIIESVKNLWPF